MTTTGGPAWSDATTDRPERGDVSRCAGLPAAFEEVNVGEYQGEERRDQSDRGKELRRLVGLCAFTDRAGRSEMQMLYALASEAWRHGFERGRSAGAKEVMEHVELELGALREGLKED